MESTLKASDPVCQWECKSFPITGIEKSTNPWERISQSGEVEIVEPSPFWVSCLAKVYANPYKEAALKSLEHIAK